MKVRVIFLVIFLFILISCITGNNDNDRDVYATEKPEWVENKPENVDGSYYYFVGGPERSMENAQKSAYKLVSEYIGMSITSSTLTDKNITVSGDVKNFERYIEESMSQAIKTETFSKLFYVEFTKNWRNSSTKEYWVLAKITQTTIDKALKEKALEYEHQMMIKTLFDNKLKEAAAKFYEQGSDKIKSVVFAKFTLKDKDIPSEFSSYYKESFESAILEKKYFSVFSDKDLFQILQDAGINL